ncbi:MAG: hypothetical protein WD042_12845 [Phycisphaeraceae bacterium]
MSEEAPPKPAPASDPGAPPSFGRQAAQLVIIPALIAIAAVTVWLIFGLLSARPDNIDDQMVRLQQSSGAGRMAGGLQDPRYKDRCLAAANIAAMLPTITDPAKRRGLHSDMVRILENNVSPNEAELHAFLLMAIGQLRQPEGLEVILSHADSKHSMVRNAVTLGIATWADQTRGGAPRKEPLPPLEPALVVLRRYLGDPVPEVAQQAAAVLGELTTPQDMATIAELRQAMARPGEIFRELHWNAAVALARLGDAAGAHYVTALLLNREALAKLPAESTGPAAPGPSGGRTLPPHDQDRIMLATLAGARGMDDPQIWATIEALAVNDPSVMVRKEAGALLAWKRKQGFDDQTAP